MTIVPEDDEDRERGHSSPIPELRRTGVNDLRQSSFLNNSAARLAADIYGMVTFLITATITARVLGPSARGYYSSLVLLGILFVQVFNGGLGEAVVVLSRRGRYSLETAVSTTVCVVAGPLGILGAGSFFLVSSHILHAQTSNARMALILGAVLVFFNVWSTTATWVLVALERMVLVAAITMICATVTTLSLWALVAVGHFGISGGVLASLVGTLVAVGVTVGVLLRGGMSFKPAWDPAFLKAAARFGAAVQFSNLLVQMAGRLDLIFVYRIAGSAAAGKYSVALTVGALVGSVPIAVAFASFPRLPGLPTEEARLLTAQVFRIGLTAAALSSLVLSAAAPLLLRYAFGSGYAGALAPALLLIPAGVLWSGQWILARSAAARGNTRPLSVSFAVSFLVMIALDCMLIRPFGVIGAAFGSLVASAAGCVTAGAYYLRWGWEWRRFVPTVADVGVMAATVRHVLGMGRRVS